MENASKALLMAGGILIGILILALMMILFLSGNEFFSGYEETKTSEAVQQFNSNFTKYVGQDLTTQQVVTICNFAKENGVNYPKTGSNDKYTLTTVKYDLKEATTKLNADLTGKMLDVKAFYTMTVTFDTKSGKVNQITFTGPTYKKYIEENDGTKCWKNF